MKHQIFNRNINISNNQYDAIIIGSGASAYNCAVQLYDRGVCRIAIYTEQTKAGTSRNTGSDKQTYYKLSTGGNGLDSFREMAATYFKGGAMDGQLALIESALSLQAFYNLINIGVPFPHNQFSEFPGYQTDHDLRSRASSAGPYTSKIMTEKLEDQVKIRKIPVISGYRAVKILTAEDEDTKKNLRSSGILFLKKNDEFEAVFAGHSIFATGGPAGLFSQSVYPASQFGASGVLAREGICFANPQEWQYGLGSIKFRWNLSGSYQQVIPRYVSIDKNGNKFEFLNQYFPDKASLVKAVFLKGYQWPFNPQRLSAFGSSVIDLACYIEKYIYGRKIFLDFRENPRFNAKKFTLEEKTDSLAYQYLSKSKALGSTPLARLKKLNYDSYSLYLDHKIDLARECLEIDVMPQHNNGGVKVNTWWESSLKDLFVIGEAAGTHGISRPGGAALNAGQVAGIRAAIFIQSRLKKKTKKNTKNQQQILKNNIKILKQRISPANIKNNKNAETELKILQKENLQSLSFIRIKSNLQNTIKKAECILQELGSGLISSESLGTLFKLDETAVLTTLYCTAALNYITKKGKSRGSYLIFLRLF